MSKESHKNKPESQKSFETWASHQDNLRSRSFRWYIDCYDDSYVDAAYTGWRMGQEDMEHKLKQRIAELEADKAELLSFVLSLDFKSIETLYFDVMSQGQMGTLISLLAKHKQPAKQESKLLTETHLPDLDENLAKLSITL